jgi:glutamine amidotransferase
MQNNVISDDQKIVIIDYGMGNLRSVFNKFKRLNINVMISSKPGDILSADKLILPGVGHFANGMKNLKEYGLLEIINEKVLIRKTPILGICLGMQLFTKYSEEGNSEGLGWFDAQTIRFKISDSKIWKVPHIGWNTLSINKDHHLLHQIDTKSMFYFVHSYHVVCNEENDILTKTTYNYEFVSGITKNNICGIQFHPEKSHDAGALMLENYAKQ